MIQGIDVIFLHTQDKSLQRWYADVLGLELGRQDGGWVEFNMQTRSRFAVEQVSTTPSQVENQPIMISFRVDNIYQAVETLAARGVHFHPTPETTIFEVGTVTGCHIPGPGWQLAAVIPAPGTWR